MSKYIYTILIDLNDMKLYSVLKILSSISTQSPYPPFPKSLFIKYIDFKIYYITQAHMCNISKHNNIIQYVNIENMGDREGIYFRLIHYIQYTFNI